jgi:DNA adenine methylase
MEFAREVRPVLPVAPYVGGKRNLAARIIARIEQIPHTIYAEAFVGLGGVFLRRRRIPKAEVINDLSEDVATLFRILQRHYTPFMDMLRWQLSSRAEFDRLLVTDPTTLTDLERAARFLYLQRTTFGGKVASRTFGVSPAEPARFNITRLAPMLEDVHDRLAGVTIERLPYAEFIDRYDRLGTLFYLDPPYRGSEGYYGKGLFGSDDFERLADQLGRIKGRFILSINDTSDTRRVFGRFAIETVGTTYTVAGGAGAKQAGELIVTDGSTG